jgi:lipopolysaccharide/colanic/teichoic acid biosynthesis glycosyltransferase
LDARPRDVVLAALALVIAAPVCAVAALAILATAGSPVLYPAARAGRNGRVFKLRTMHSAPANARITATDDERVFTVGRWLRRLKLDELPQLINVLRGEMAIIGPRPEDPEIVARCYNSLARQTLAVRPGLASPGSLFHFTHGERQLAPADAEAAYVQQLLPLKLALDLVYLRHASFAYDLRVIGRVAAAILGRAIGRRTFPDPPEMVEARQLEYALHSGAPMVTVP